eukprot:2766236-Pleurochrysis_carterae.AAC.1
MRERCCRMYSTKSSNVSPLYSSPPGAAGSTKRRRFANARNSAHQSSAVASRRLSAASRARARNEALSASTRCTCFVVGSPCSHSSTRRSVSAPVSWRPAAFAWTRLAAVARASARWITSACVPAVCAPAAALRGRVACPAAVGSVSCAVFAP